MRRRGGRRGEWPAKPATTLEVSTDPEPSKPAISGEVSTDASPSKPATTAQVSTDSGRRPWPPPPARAPRTSACEPFRELIAEALARGRNAVAIWQDLFCRPRSVDTSMVAALPKSASLCAKKIVGSIVKTTTTTGGVAASRRYDSFGNLEAGLLNGYAFTGREWDVETGLYYYRARYYDPTAGRFISEDPIRFLGGFNFYSYVGNKPVNRIDPFGLQQYPNNFVGPLPPTGYYTSQMLKTACGLIPPAPPGANVRQNMRQAASHVSPFWFYNQVRNKGPWDYKQQGAMYEDFGNFNYGASCKAFGFPENTCLREAGRGQQAAGTSQPNWGNPGSRMIPGEERHPTAMTLLIKR